MIDLLVVALAFGAIFVVELPDKTFIATLVMSTKMRPLFVWIGVALAFLVQTGIAVGLGKAASFLPEQLIHVAAAAMFAIGAVILFREARSADEEEAATEDEYAAKADAGTPSRGTHDSIRSRGPLVQSAIILPQSDRKLIAVSSCSI